MTFGIDLHTHTSRSHDGSGTVMDWCERAIERGLTVIGFSEHVDRDENDIYFDQLDFDAYRDEVQEARAKFAGRLSVRLGIEVGYMPAIEKNIADWIQDHPVDFVTGSVHTIFENGGISSEYDALETFARHEFWEAYDEYFETVAAMVKSGLFDVVGHFDLVHRYGVNYLKNEMEWGRVYGPVTRALEGMILRQMALEINTSGLRQPPKSCYPDRKLIELYSELGGRHITIGSDAHDPDLLAAGMDEAAGLVQRYGLVPVDFSERRMRELEDRS